MFFVGLGLLLMLEFCEGSVGRGGQEGWAQLASLPLPLLHKGSLVDDGQERVDVFKVRSNKVKGYIVRKSGCKGASQGGEWWLKGLESELEVVAAVEARLLGCEPWEGHSCADRGGAKVAKHVGEGGHIGVRDLVLWW